jgi:hypothetical protein
MNDVEGQGTTIGLRTQTGSQLCKTETLTGVVTELGNQYTEYEVSARERLGYCELHTHTTWFEEKR